VAVFGLKDYQQFQIVRRMVRDLNFNVQVVGHPIVRGRDGLALSSRNAYLSPEERKAAPCLSRSLRIGESMVLQGARESRRILDAVRRELDRERLARVEYVRICDPEELEEVQTIDREALLALAVWIGRARLIDNTLLKA